jgi:hypothetical protein
MKFRNLVIASFVNKYSSESIRNRAYDSLLQRIEFKEKSVEAIVIGSEGYLVVVTHDDKTIKKNELFLSL